MCVYDNCPYNCETKYAHRKRFAAMKKSSLKDNYHYEDKILSTKQMLEYIKDHKCLSTIKL